MLIITNLYLICSVTIIGLLLWFAADMRAILKMGQRKNQLSIDGRWKELEEHFKRRSKTWRPFVRFNDRYLLPGANQVQHALFLQKQGRFEEALPKADQAIRLVKTKPKIFKSIHKSATEKILLGALQARAMILTGMGRYDEARQSAAESVRLDQSGHAFNPALALLEFSCGRLDEVIAQTRVVSPENAHFDSMRTVMAIALYTKGEFDQAAQALMFEPGDASKYYTPEGLKLVSGIPEGAKLIELQNKKIAGVFQPARLILLAKMRIAQEDFPNADLMLDAAEKKLGPAPAIQLSYYRYRATSLAAQGKAAEAENHIQRMRAIVQESRKRSQLWEMHFSTGRCYAYLGRHGDALVEFENARQFVLHPIEKHSTNYWFANIHEATGDKPQAIKFYQAVIADGIPSWMRKKATEALERHNN